MCTRKKCQQGQLENETDDPSPRGRENQGSDRYDRKQEQQRELLSPPRAEEEESESQRCSQLNESSEMVTIHERSEGPCSRCQSDEPIKFSVESEMLDNPKERDDKP